MKGLVLSRVYLAVLLAFMTFAGAGAEKPTSDAEAYVSGIADEMLMAVHADAVSTFQTLFREHADIAAISKIAAGRYARVMSPSERDQVKRYVANTIGQAFANYAGWLRGERVEVTGSRESGNEKIVVFTRLIGGSVDDIKWKLVRDGDGFRVLDVNIGGLWLSMQLRAMLSARLKQARGDVTAALAD